MSRFRDFHLNRAKAGLPAEAARNRMRNVAALSRADVTQVLMEMPLEKFERRSFLWHERDVAWIRFDGALWRSLSGNDLAEARRLAEDAVHQYFSRGDRGGT